MMIEIAETDLSGKISEVLQAVLVGEHYRITRAGKPIAEIHPIQENDVISPAQAVDGILNIRKTIHLKGDSLRDYLEEGRRF